ncbi:lytic murein transglycosylase, partial [Thioclava sp. BHET1]
MVLLAGAGAGQAAACGGSFSSFVTAMEQEAVAAGNPKARVMAFFRTARLDPAVLRADQGQGIFRRTFTDFSGRIISDSRLSAGKRFAHAHAAVFAEARKRYGVSEGVLLSLLAFETDFGAVQGDYNTLNALMTLGHDCRRPQMFQTQVMAALKLYERGSFDPATTTGAWAGEVGIVQMLPKDILERGVDGDGDGKVTLKTSVPDAVLSAANMLKGFGWQAGQPWLVEVKVPQNLDWAKSGLDHSESVAAWAKMGVRARSGALPPGGLSASLLLPQGRKGPAFLAFDNFRVLFHWNKSFVYVTTVGYFATRMEGAPRFDPGHPDPQLSLADMKALQRKLAARGFDVGAIDGILGAGTRAAVQKAQEKLG